MAAYELGSKVSLQLEQVQELNSDANELSPHWLQVKIEGLKY